MSPKNSFDNVSVKFSRRIQSQLPNGGPNYSNMDDAFCDRMCAAIAAGLETAPIGVVTTPGTKNPRYLATEPRPLASSKGGMDL
jgi:hypothetical protein